VTRNGPYGKPHGRVGVIPNWSDKIRSESKLLYEESVMEMRVALSGLFAFFNAFSILARLGIDTDYIILIDEERHIH